ncbi:hypothetical protein [Mesorhizobium sp. M0199]|uniref:hypothetical protein n=1 Tax=Mesorhizobium sp. M0199 TaxID=2956911 RepID=UPI0033374294
MSQQPVHAVSGRLILLIKSGYWLALLIIAAMVVASFILLQQVMATQRHNQALLDIVSTQKALSQRIVFLAGATGSASRDQQHALVSALKQATVEFEKNYDLLLERTAADPVSPARFDPKSIESVLFAKPYHLDYFSVGLIANGERLISSFESRLNTTGSGGYKGGEERVNLDASVANATLSGYAASASAPTRTSAPKGSSIFIAHCSIRPSASSCWWHFSFSGRCRMPSCAGRASWSMHAIPWPSLPCMTG